MELAALFVRVGADIRELQRGFSKAEREVMRFGRRMEDVGATLTAALTVPLAGLGFAATRAAIDFESSFAGIRKTMDLTEAEFDRLAQANRDLAKEIPVAVDELNRIGELAGQLGINGVENVLKFERTIADLTVTTNLTAEAAALSFAQIANVMQLPQDQIDRLGSVVVGLGNNFATVESKIVDFTQRIAGAGQLAGLTVGQVAAIGTAFASLGIEAEAGGTAIQKVLLGMHSAVAEGGQALEQFAETAGVTAEGFVEMYRRDAGGAFVEFVEGLKRQGDGAIGALNSLGLSSERVRSAFLSAAGAGDLLRRAMVEQEQLWRDNNALTKEAEQRYATAASQLQIFWNRLRDVAITIGAALVPALLSALDATEPLLRMVASLANAFAGLPESVQVFAASLAGLAAAAGPVLFVVGNLVATLPKLALLLGSLTGPIGLITAALGVGAAAWLAWGTSARDGAREAQAAADQAAAAIRQLSREQLIGITASLLSSQEALQSELSSIESRLERARRRVRAGQGWGIGVVRELEAAADATRQKIADTEGQIQRLVSRFNDLESAAGSGGAAGGVAGLGAEVSDLATGLESAVAPATKLADEMERLNDALSGLSFPELATGQRLNPEGRDRMQQRQRERREFEDFGGIAERIEVVPPPIVVDTSGGGWLSGVTDQLRSFVSGIGSQIKALAAQFGPLALAALALKPVFDGLRTALAPALEALAAPLRQIGEMLGSIIAPLFEALAEPLAVVGQLVQALLQPLRASVAVIVAYITPGLKVLGAVVKAVNYALSFLVQGVGFVVLGLGKAAGALSFGAAGKGLRRSGEEIIDFAEDMRRGTEQTTDNLEDLGEAVADVTASLVNYARVAHINALRFMVSGRGGGAAGGGNGAGGGNMPGTRPPAAGPFDPPGRERPQPGVTITGPVTVVAQDPDELGRKLQRIESRGGTTRIALQT